MFVCKKVPFYEQKQACKGLINGCCAQVSCSWCSGTTCTSRIVKMKDPSLSKQLFTEVEPLFSATKMSVKSSSFITVARVCEGNNSHRSDYFSGSSATGENQFHRTSSQSGTLRCIHGSPFFTPLRSVLQNCFYIKYPHKTSEFIVFKWHYAPHYTPPWREKQNTLAEDKPEKHILSKMTDSWLHKPAAQTNTEKSSGCVLIVKTPPERKNLWISPVKCTSESKQWQNTNVFAVNVCLLNTLATVSYINSHLWF